MGQCRECGTVWRMLVQEIQMKGWKGIYEPSAFYGRCEGIELLTAIVDCSKSER